MMWLNISFSPYQHYAVGAALSRKRKAACRPNSVTSRRSAEVQNLFHSIAEWAAKAFGQRRGSGPLWGHEEPFQARTLTARVGSTTAATLENAQAMVAHER